MHSGIIIRIRKKDHFSDFEAGMAVFQKLQIHWEFPTYQCLWITENGQTASSC